jgi:hypothetical protein
MICDPVIKISFNIFQRPSLHNLDKLVLPLYVILLYNANGWWF